MNRRNFIKAGVLAGLSSSVLQAAVDKKSEKNCIYIYLGGGISQIEFINPLVNAPIEYRSVNGSVLTKSGYEIGGTFTNLAQCSDLFTTVRSLHHGDGNHYTAAHWVNTGHMAFGIVDNGPSKEPFYGTIVNQQFNSNSVLGMPHYIKVNKIPHDGPSWLGSKYMGYDNDSEATKNLKLENRERFEYKTKMMKEVNRHSFKAGNNSKLFKDWDDTRNSALEIILGDTSKAFDMSLEDEKSKLRYKVETSAFGRNLLMARRFIENGSKFVTLSNDGWDTHTEMTETFQTRGVELDMMLSILLQDLNERGLLKDTLVVVCSEFSRTPRKNAMNSRDHYPNCNSLLLAGGGYGGSLIGKTDDKGTIVTDNPFTPSDLCWTILNHFEISKDLVIVDNQSRPRHIIEKEAKLIV